MVIRTEKYTFDSDFRFDINILTASWGQFVPNVPSGLANKPIQEFCERKYAEIIIPIMNPVTPPLIQNLFFSMRLL